MKAVVFGSLLFLISLPTFAQEKPNTQRHLGVTSSVYFYEKSYKGFITPYFEIRENFQAFSVGPTILTTSEFDASDRMYPKLTGFEVTYKLYPTISNRKVDFYLHGTLLFQRIIDKWEVNYWNDSYSFYESTDYKNIETIVNPTIGYGLSFDILKRVKVHQGIGAGYFFSGVKGDNTKNESSEVDHHDYRPYGDGGFAFQVNLGMSYNIGKKQ